MLTMANQKPQQKGYAVNFQGKVIATNLTREQATRLMQQIQQRMQQIKMQQAQQQQMQTFIPQSRRIIRIKGRQFY